MSTIVDIRCLKVNLETCQQEKAKLYSSVFQFNFTIKSLALEKLFKIP